MSHCIACNGFLSDVEAAQRHKITKEEIGLCDACLAEVLAIQFIPIVGRGDDVGVYLDEPLPTDEVLESDYLLSVEGEAHDNED